MLWINLHAMFEFYWQQRQQRAEAHYIEKIQSREDTHLVEEHLDVSDEESED